MGTYNRPHLYYLREAVSNAYAYSSARTLQEGKEENVNKVGAYLVVRALRRSKVTIK